jgi:hypothetical protein
MYKFKNKMFIATFFGLNSTAITLEFVYENTLQIFFLADEHCKHKGGL